MIATVNVLKAVHGATPRLHFSLHGVRHTVTALPDSGSACNIVGLGFINKMGLPVTKADSNLFHITSATGHPLPIVGTTTATVIMNDSQHYLLPLLVTKADLPEMILGWGTLMDWGMFHAAPQLCSETMNSNQQAIVNTISNPSTPDYTEVPPNHKDYQELLAKGCDKVLQDLLTKYPPASRTSSRHT